MPAAGKMEAKYMLFCITFLIVQVSCEKKRSLTFVIDNSYSMRDDIKYVRNASKSIMDIVLNETSSQIEDIVLVTFNDPTREFRMRTRNEAELKKALDDITLVGNWDCPEMSLSGIELGLEESLPGSFLYVSTDASAKDYRMYEKIKNLCQEKQIQVVFVLTGECEYDPIPDRFRVYYKIAAASNGQVFRIEKENVGEVLQYVKETIKGDRTVITSTVVDAKTNSDSYVYFNIDDKTEYALVSASGSGVTLKVHKHEGTFKEIRGEMITWTNNVKVLKLVGITPGQYRAVVRGSSDVNVMVFGRTDFNFEFGFSNEHGSSLKGAETQPTIGTETHLIISVKDDEHSVNIQNVEILDMQETVIMRLPLINVGDNVYTTENFLPHNIMFKVAVTAKARSTGKPIRRIANTPVEPIKPVVVAPEITDTEKNIRATEGSTTNVHCRIRQGKPKPAVTWYFKQRGATYFSLLKDKTDEVLRVSNVAVHDAGEYKCVAKNVAGEKAHVIQLEVEALPAFVKTPSVLKPRVSSSVEIPCKISKGAPLPTIKWQFKRTTREEFRNIDNTGEYLRIANVQLSNSGFYKCQAKNTVGTAQQVIQVVVLVPPKIEKENVHVTQNEGSNVLLSCGKIVGNPPPTVKWMFRKLGSNTAKPLKAAAGLNKLEIESAKLENSGTYTCRVENEAGFDEHAMKVTIQAVPQLEVLPKNIMAKESSSVRIVCKVTKGSPPPILTWSYKANNADHYETIKVNAATLELTNLQGHDSGLYKCEAKNNAGTVTQNVELIVEVLPEFKDTSETITEIQNTAVTIDCKLRKGNPPPRITWQFRAGGSATFTTLGNSGTELRLPVLQLKDSGEYKCIAANSAGSVHKTTFVTVLAPPEIDTNTLAIVRAKENATLSLKCRISKGFPKPTVTWLHKNYTSSDYVTIGYDEEYLRLENIQMNNAGHYKCVARNRVGHVEKDTQVIVEAPARIVIIPPQRPFYEGVEGDVVMRVPCAAVGHPKPSVTWVVNHVVIGNDKSRTLYVEDGVLYLKNPKETDSSNGTDKYVCQAENEFGKFNQVYQVNISKYADYDQPEVKCGEIKKPYDLKCPLLYTDPNSVRWFVNEEALNKTGPSLHFEDPTQSDDGNYTCRVSDLNGAASYSMELMFGYPPSASKLVRGIEWNEDGDNNITCKAADNTFETKYEWYHHGNKIKEADDAEELELYVIEPGQYECRVSNPLGSLKITFNVHAKDCVFASSLLNTKNVPLVLDKSSTWPSFSRNVEIQIVPKWEKLTFICQDESPKYKSDLASNSFVKFPNTKSVIATCDHDDLFLVDGVSHKLSELNCKEAVPSRVIESEECLGSGTMMMNVGFNVNGFLDVYKSCLDTKRNVVLYTEVKMTGADRLEYTNEPEGPCKSVADCCYESVQLVSAADVSAGPAARATFREQLNSVSYCRPSNETTMSWHVIEEKVRRAPSRSRMIVWSGAFNYTTVDKLLVPQYLWKVVKNLDSEEIVAIVHSNEQTPSGSVCESVCHESTWFEPYGPRTYCCRLDELKRAFHLTINF